MDTRNLYDLDLPKSQFFMVDLVGYAIHHANANYSVATDTEIANLLSNEISAPGNSQSKTGLVMLLLFANFMYFVMMITLLGIFAHLTRSRRDPAFGTTITIEEKSIGMTSVSNFIFLELSLACRLTCCALILLHVTDLASAA